MASGRGCWLGAVVAGSVVGAAAVAPAQSFRVQVNGATSSFAGTVNATVNFSGTMLGSFPTVPPPPAPQTATRTLRGLSGNTTDLTLNQTIAISGSGSAAATPSTRPVGAFSLKLTPDILQIVVAQTQADVLAGARPTAAVNASLGYESFRTRTPNYSYISFGVPIPLALDPATVTEFALNQLGPLTAALTPTGPQSYSFAGEAEFEATVTVVLQGTETAQVLVRTLPVSGTVTVAPGGQSATATLTITTSFTEPVAPQPPAPPVPFQLPPPPPPLAPAGAPAANVVLTLTVTGGTTAVTGSGTLPATGPLALLADIVAIGGGPGADGTITVDDYTSFINAFAGDELVADVVSIGGFPPPDGSLTVDDYTSFINAFADAG